MKFLLAAALLAFLSISCNKNRVVSGQSAVTGKWELTKEIGGFAGIISYEHGQGTVSTFDSGKKFWFLFHNGSALNGTYQIKESSSPGDWILTLQYLQNGQSQTQTDSIRFDKNQLIILPFASCCDIQTSYYERLQ